MNTKIVVALVAVAFVTGMMASATDTNAAKKATPSDVKKFTSQTLKTTLHHLQLSNDFFLSPPEREIPREEMDEIQRLLDQIKDELLVMDDKHKDWIEITTPAGG